MGNVAQDEVSLVGGVGEWEKMVNVQVWKREED